MHILKNILFRKKAKLPYIRQRSEAENSFVCLLIMLKYFIPEFNISDFKSRVAHLMSDASLSDLIKVFKENSIQPRALHCPVEDIEQLSLPCIIHWKYSKFSILKEIKNEMFYVCDPADRRTIIIYDKDEFECYYCEVALELKNLRDVDLRIDNDE